jgi:hypothetical protein
MDYDSNGHPTAEKNTKVRTNALNGTAKLKAHFRAAIGTQGFFSDNGSIPIASNEYSAS